MVTQFKRAEPESIGSILGGFRQYSKQEMAERLYRGGHAIKLDGDGVAVCRKCGGARMFHLVGFGKDCWLPIACECMREEAKRDEFAERVKENKARSGIYGRDAYMNFNRFPKNAENARAFDSALNYCKNIDSVLERGQGIYIYGATGTHKTLLALCIANFLLEDGRAVKFVEACDVLFPIGNGNLYNANGQNENANLIAECIATDVLILDNLGDDDFATSRGVTASAAQRRLAKIIEGRYGKSTIFTSNHSIEMLAEECHVKLNTVDRIREMATRIFHFDGKSYRHPAVLNEIKF